MKHATSRLLFAYWDELRGDRLAPERREIEPGRIRHVLADTFVLAAEASGAATFRLAGTRCAALFGRDLREEPFEALWDEADSRATGATVAQVVSDMRGVVLGAVATNAGGSRLPLEIVLLPLRHSGQERSRLIGAMSPASLLPWTGVEPVSRLHTTSLRVIYGERPPLPGERLFAARQQRRFVVHEGGKAAAAELPL